MSDQMTGLPVAEPEENAFKSIQSAMMFHVDVDWNRHHREAWIYGIVLGWDDSLQVVAKKHGWSDKEVARLKRLHEQFRATAGE